MIGREVFRGWVRSAFEVTSTGSGYNGRKGGGVMMEEVKLRMSVFLLLSVYCLSLERARLEREWSGGKDPSAHMEWLCGILNFSFHGRSSVLVF
jgi:hypothetical protein